MIRYKKIISIAMSMVVMATAFSTNVFACRPNIIEVEVDNLGKINVPDNFLGERRINVQNDRYNEVFTANIGREINKLVGTFKDFTNLRTVNIPEDSKLKTIGENAFSGCTNLENITIPDSVTSIGLMAFSGCTGLKKITIPDNVTKIDKYAFLGCTELKEVNIGIKSVNYFRDVFMNSNVEKVTIRDGATSIGKEAFKDCKKLREVDIPNSVKTIDDRAFTKCTSLERVKIRNKQQINDVNAKVLSKIGEMAFMGCKRLAEVDIPDSVTRIEMCAFLGCESLTSISIPDNVKTLEEFIFFNCNKLEEISLPSKKSLKTDNDSFAGIISDKNLRIYQRTQQLKERK